MAENFPTPHVSSDLLTDIQFWMKIVRDSKRTIFCPPALVEQVEERIREFDLEASFEVQASAACPENKILIVDKNALDLSFSGPMKLYGEA